jgi:hypothetical protein
MIDVVKPAKVEEDQIDGNHEAEKSRVRTKRNAGQEDGRE